MNVLIDNLTGVTSTSAGQHRLDGRPVRAHDELDHHGIGWRVGSFAVRLGPGDPFAWSVERYPGLDQPADRPPKSLQGSSRWASNPACCSLVNAFKALKMC
jgi:hypothetical protein